jgi:hypothetical protein
VQKDAGGRLDADVAVNLRVLQVDEQLAQLESI